MAFLRPDWPAPAGIHSLVSLRSGGESLPPYDSLNPALHVGDNSAHVIANRSLIEQEIATISRAADIQWLNQTHSTTVVEARPQADPGSKDYRDYPDADACFTRQPLTACAVMTADCLPLLFCRLDGSAVAATHAGWKGLANGIIEQTMLKLGGQGEALMVWLGPAIGPARFEVGPEVKTLFTDRSTYEQYSATAACFQAKNNGKFLADIYQLAKLRLQRCGIQQIYGGGLCTVSDRQRFFSYRRDGVTGRLASLIWIDR
ncbi:hypothetical protein EDC56_1349 [Sinobacterium caligoides]|uniref:Purine nucleoside phosphorylase n=1 Tax=Sinobacterium caligoides TaxID=933926 RepID=A0A3N2E2J5_9GAMM|nr:peptidoglycan editing factor PgeF [Sinobacterium caligoides]ROS05795.1 hypothetical protein EDC56_1349 [Sinobacterium caligoides]